MKLCTKSFKRMKKKKSYTIHIIFRYDKDDCEPLTKSSRNTDRPRHHHCHHIRRRISKRYTNIVDSSSRDIFLLRKDLIDQEKQTFPSLSKPRRSFTKISHRHSLRPVHEAVHCFNSHRKNKPCQTKDHDYNSIINSKNILAHRMQAAMSSELVYSLNRNFVSANHEQVKNHSFMGRSCSFNIGATKNIKSEHYSYDHLRPRIRIDFNKEHIPVKLPTPDYDEPNEEIIMYTIENENNIDEEPIVDYEDSKPTMKYEFDGKTKAYSDCEVLSSFMISEITTDNNDTQLLIPPRPPPLPNLNLQPKKITVRCRTIADKLSSNHKLILKDEDRSGKKE